MNAEYEKILRSLCDGVALSAYENDLIQLIAEEVLPYTEALKIDGMGNLVATRGNSKSLLITAHVDEVGFIITGISNDGTLRFQPIGGIDPRSLPSKRVFIGHDCVLGVIGAVPVHMKKENSDQISYHDLYINIGAENKQEAEALVKTGDLAVFETKMASWKTDTDASYCAKAFDNRIGCLLLIRLLRETKIEGTFVFTVQEEVGTRGAQAFCLKNSFSLAIALDTTTANDLPGVSSVDRVCKAGGGIVISYADGATIYDRKLVKEAFTLLEKQCIPAQTKSRRTGGNEASAIQKCGLGSPVLSLSTPCRYIHSSAGIVKEEDVENSFLALKAIAEHHVKGGFNRD